MNRNNFTMANKYLFYDRLLFESREGDETTPFSFAAEIGGIDACSSLLEAPIATHHMQGDMNGSSLPAANNYLFTNLVFLYRRRG